MTQPTPAAPRLLPVIPAVFACALVLGLSVLPPSTSRILVWPWAGFAALGWVLALGTVFFRIAAARPNARFGGLMDAGFGVLALSAVASAFTSPVGGAILPQVLPFLGICALPYLLLPCLHPADTGSTRRFHLLISGLCLFILVVSLTLWLDPWNGCPGWGSRNAQPFGHSNTTGSFAALAATWLAYSALSSTVRRARLLAATGSVLSAATALSSQSRGAILALAVAATVFAAIHLLGRRRYLTFAVLGLLIFAGTVAASSRLRELVVHQRWNTSDQESNRQRAAMILGGIALGNERPLLGWGAGAVPHVFPRVRASLPGTADNFLHLHNTPAQLWATLGSAGLLGGLLIAAGIVTRLRSAPWSPARTALAAGLAGTATILLFDHPFGAPAFALLAAALLAAWVTPAPACAARPARLASGVGLIAVLAVLPSAARDLAARAAYDAALTQAEHNNPDGYGGGLRRAIHFAPSDPYYAHALAAFLTTGHPFSGVHPTPTGETVSLLEGTLAANPDLEYAHYNLGWLLLASDPRESARHFRESSRLAPQRGSVFLGLGLARIRLNDNNGAVRAFATEWLLNPATAWSPIWGEPPLDALLPAIRALASSAARTHGAAPWINLKTPATVGAPYRRLRTGYGVLMGHPEGPVPVDFNIQTRVTLPTPLRDEVPAFGWLDGGTLLEFLESTEP